MIERYSRPEMTIIWETENKYRKWLDVELAACEAYRDLGIIPDEDFQRIKNNATFDAKKIDEIEKEVKHDVIAFLTNVNESLGESAKYMHLGLTSSDVLDTSLSLLVKEANLVLFNDMTKLIGVLREKALEHKNTIMIGRSHGIHAEPITMGLKFAVWYDIMKRNYERLSVAAEDMYVGQISGAVGTYANVNPEVEEITCRILELKPARISTQIIQRDIHANYIQTLGLIASCIESFATEIRNLQRTDVLEVEEGFSNKQKGSSAMPHKKNPISSENICGLARLIRGYTVPALENITLWHERDISHSSVERVIFPDATILMNYMLNRFVNTVKNLRIYPDNMLRNMNKAGGVIFSQQVMLKLVEKTLSREEAYRVVQRHAHEAWNNENGNFKNAVLNDPMITSLLSNQEIESCFDPNYHLRNINHIYERLELS